MGMALSVVIPAYNAQDHLGRALESVLAQTHRVQEIIVVDDGSTDDTGQVARQYASAVRYFRQDNRGVSSARNRGIAEATGDWIAFLDADDEWLPHLIETHVEALRRHPNLRWSYCCGEHVRNGTPSAWPLPNDIRSQLIRDGCIPYFHGAARRLQSVTSGFMIHRSVFDDVGLFDPSMCSGEDRDMWTRIGMRFPVLAYSTQACWRYHDTPGSLCKREGGTRDPQLRSICRNMRHAMAVGPEVANAFLPSARPMAYEFLIRAAARRTYIAPATIEEARSLFPLTLCERIALRTVACLPKALAGRISRRVQP